MFSILTHFDTLNVGFVGTLSFPNRSPKGNISSAIPVALLCMIVNWSDRKQGSGPAPKGTKSCRTQGDFYSSIRPTVCPSVHSLKSTLSGLGGTDGWTDRMTNESPPVFYRTSSPLGCCPKRLKDQ